MRNLLIITAEVPCTCAQGVRYINIFKQLKEQFNITHLTYNNNIFSIEGCTNISVLPFFEIILPKVLIKGYRYLCKRFFFPDEYILKIFLYKNAIRKKIQENKFDAIIICMTPFSFLKLGTFIKQIDSNINLIADFSDPFSANALYYKNKKKQNKALLFEKKYIINFNSIIVLNDKIKEYYLSQGYKNIFTIEQGVDELFTQFSIMPPLNNKLKLVYAGGFYKNFRDPSILFSSIKDSNLDIEFNIFGGSNKNIFNFSNYKFVFKHKHIHHNKLIEEYKNAHVLVIIDNFYGMQVPGKTIECLSYNRPILFIYENIYSPTLLYLKDTKGVYLSTNHKSEIIMALNQIKKEYNQIKKTFDFEPYLWHNLSIKFNSILENNNTQNKI